MNHSFLSALLFSCFVFVSCTTQKTNVPPNVLIVLADDLGSTDLACYGGKALSPNLDKLAKNGIRFTNFYAPAPNCSPSRAGLLTGRMPSRVGMYNYRAPKQEMHLREHELTLAEYLKVSGYQTAHFGKWHLGCLPQDTSQNHPQPEDHGFEFSIGTENNASPSHLNPNNFVRNGVLVGETEGYSCQILAQEVKDWFLNSYKPDKPFFLYVALHEVHSKIASPPEMVKHYPNESETDAEYLANVENLDDATGKIVQLLKNCGLLDNTFLIFASDNGPYRKGSAGELRGLKGEVYEGGIRIPAIFHWPEKLKKEKVIDIPASLLDVLPTVTHYCNTTISQNRPLDGTDLSVLFSGGTFERNTPLMWFYYRSFPEVALRMDNYVLMGNALDSIPRTHPTSSEDMKFIKSFQVKEYELYDLVTDPGQQNNLVHLKPEIVEKMKPHMDRLLEEIKAQGPNWEHMQPSEGLPKRFKKDYSR